MNQPARKKVLFVITKSNWGGAQRYVFDLATSLPHEQFEVAVALGGAGELVQKLRDANIAVLPLTSVERDLSLFADLRGFAALYRAMRAYRPDIVHLNSSKVGGLGALAARMIGALPTGRQTRIIFTAHGWPFEEKRNGAWRTFAWLGSWATALLSHAVIVISKRELELGQRMPFCRGKMRLVYNGIALPFAIGSGTVIRDAFPTGAHITGTIGELNHNKNQIALIEEARNNPAKFVAIVGEGEERKNLEVKIHEYGLESRVKLFGFMPASEVLGGFDTFALPSLKEGLPYVLLEAKAVGLPIVANRIGGIGEILDAPDMSLFSLEHMLSKTISLYTH